MTQLGSPLLELRPDRGDAADPAAADSGLLTETGTPALEHAGLPHRSVVVVGGGQAGLSVSWHLVRAGIDHVVLERGDRGCGEWSRSRWDNFCLVTPNWQCRLPGWPYRGDDPDGFMTRDEIIRYLDGFVASFDPPLRTGVEVTRVRRTSFGRFLISTSAGDMTAEHVVIGTGGYQIPIIPPWAAHLPASVTQLHSSLYRNADQLPAGDVLVVGSGQSGAQIAEDLHLEGRRVHLCLGDAPRVARFYRGRDVTAWLDEIGYYRMTADDRPSQAAEQARANHYVTGRDGGRDIDLRRFAAEGMRLYGLLEDFDGTHLRFRPDLRQSLDFADRVSEGIKDTIDRHIADKGIDAPTEERYRPVWEPDEEPTELELAPSGITSVLWCIGYRADHRWIDVGVFNGRGAPVHRRGVTTDPGLYFIGLPWQWTWGSARLSGVADDAEHVVGAITARLGAEVGAAGDVNDLAFGR